MGDLLDVQADTDAVARRVANWLFERAHAKVGPFIVSLSGGSTPRALYTLLADPAYRDKFPWRRTTFFFGDERFVPNDHPDSNYRMVRETILAHVPQVTCHAWPTDGDPPDAARRYEVTLRETYGATVLSATRPLFDVMLLGLGDDGHTASLFPGVPALRETVAWTTAVIGSTPEPRLTLTLPAIASNAAVAFLAVGRAKREILSRALQRDPAIPASHVKSSGNTHWFVDAAAIG